jgi:hypothetical protein
LSRIATRSWTRGWAFALALAASACGGDPATPEARIRALLAGAEAAAEAKDAGGLKELVSDAYADDQGQDKRAVMGLVTFYFMRHQTIHLLTRVDRIELADDGSARAGVFVAMAGTPILGLDDLARLRADLYRFDFALAEENDDWRVTSASWRRAETADFLPDLGS